MASHLNEVSGSEREKDSQAKNQRLHGRSIFLAYARPSVINSAFSGIGDGNSNTERRLESRSMNAFSSPQLLTELFLQEKHNDREHARH